MSGLCFLFFYSLVTNAEDDREDTWKGQKDKIHSQGTGQWHQKTIQILIFIFALCLCLMISKLTQ